ncbi:MAG: polysaccharide deacetylase family protein [Flavobacteriales bacterium]|nr:polysaccharide deacetylase family protein [Flavobacteriales bacterium]
MFLVKTPLALKKTFPSLVWDIPNNTKTIYLTFDDGPTPEVTTWVLATLKQYNAKATFFVVGDNVKKHPQIYQQLIAEGHAIGNHTYNHLNGWKTKSSDYLQNIEKCAELVDSNLFRPPYGRIKNTQIKKLKQDYNIIMWDVLSGDFDAGLSPEKCAENVISNTKSGSIIVFHDSIKAEKNLKYALPKAIEYLKSKGFVFNVITEG